MVDHNERAGFARAAWVNVLGNAAKIVVEGAAGLVFGSVALLADAAHSVADLVSSVVVLVWGKSAYDEPDDTHPHGHDRIEPLTALFVGAVLAVLGLSLLYESVQGLLVLDPPEANPLLLAALAFAMVDMYLVYRYTEYVNADLGSTALEALAVDCLNDIYTTIAAAVGIVGVLLGHPLLDPIAGGLVSLLVVSQGVEIGRENLDYLVGAAPDSKKRTEITETLRAHPAVEGVHDLTVFYDGTVLEVEVHVEVDGDMPFRRAHDVESELVDDLQATEDVGDAHVHLDPSGIGEWKAISEDRRP
ncbi:cation diffusion facilitator family transporter [Natronobacterium gregoryi]|uniref:Cation diffusion facilitator family transporter n=2 Tax=Natronobacterium gregoryi TaxID=44930 RepID=L0AF33_NATGS|nr:cation diffusion facilitator family transporter [Natronobacterium gregoryi]AFZ72451.1 cation diffusion facilitator family transporter [Natronobacterium gregoryi SP2]ELY74322.1 cation diffusion facilitator family transporter [Natronobacterium gregoryi SP2]PLK21425.1 cation transporter [Natronobacterium gregoryi SP2]SFI78279.1 cation diffusion facilitator family transporter [Natronobacterium gregoryi]